MQAPLSDREKAALRKVGFGGDDTLEAVHAKRLLHLELIEWGGYRWRLTSIGCQRYHALVGQSPSGAAS